MNLRVLQDTSNFAPLPSVADIFNLDNIAKGIISFRVISLKIMYPNFLNDLVCFQSRLGLLFSFRALQYVNYLFTFFSKVFQFSSFFFLVLLFLYLLICIICWTTPIRLSLIARTCLATSARVFCPYWFYFFF